MNDTKKAPTKQQDLNSVIMISTAGKSVMPVTGCIVHRITGEHATKKPSAVCLYVALETYYTQRKKKPTTNTSMAWKRGRMPDLTSHNELAVNGVQWGASLRALETVNINTQASCSFSTGREYPVEKLSQGTGKYEEANQHQNIVAVYRVS